MLPDIFTLARAAGSGVCETLRVSPPGMTIAVGNRTVRRFPTRLSLRDSHPPRAGRERAETQKRLTSIMTSAFLFEPGRERSVDRPRKL
jgi:hypothetical protein